MARRKLSDHGVAILKARPVRYAFPDPELSGHFIRVQPSGAKSYCAVARDGVTGKQVWATIAATDLISIEEARTRARTAIQRIKAGREPFEPLPPKPASFDAVADDYLKRHVTANNLRSKSEIERILTKYVRPRWGERDFKSLRRSDVVTLLDQVVDDNGARQADAVLAIARGIFSWFAARNDDYASPVARGMRRTDPKTRKRTRILNDDEIRAVWAAASTGDTFGDLVRLLLLTVQRRERVSAMRWDEISAGDWCVPAEERAKGAGGVLRLPKLALEIIDARPRVGENPFVFAGRGDVAFNSFSEAKAALDERVKIAPWVLHDLRRTGRSLMPRAGVRPDIAERVMGHVIPGVEGIYDRYTYYDEKADALRRLAGLIEIIVNPPAVNVICIREAGE